MGQTKEGARKTAETNKLKYGEDYYRKIGAKGGRVKNPNKGFGNDDRTILNKILRRRKLAAIAGQKGGRISKRRKQVTEAES